MPLGTADVATALWTHALRFDAADPTWPDRDRFVLSAGHGSALLYALGWLNGYAGVELDHLRSFRQIGSPAAGHPEWGHFPGVETTTGPLGQGIATAVGMAIAEARLRDEFGAGLCDHRTWVLAGDGCLMEGISQEAVSLAGHLRLDRLTVLWDDNRITIDGSTELSTSDDQLRRFDASGWNTARIDGHDRGAIINALDAALAADRPTLLACRTTIGRGSPNRAGSHAIHGSPLGAEERAAMAKVLKWPFEPFAIPDKVVAAWRHNGERGRAARLEWQQSIQSDAGTRFVERLERPVTALAAANLAQLRASVAATPCREASRISSRRAIEAIVPVMPSLLGGSADLSASNGTLIASHRTFSATDRGGSYVQYGIREHAMAAAMNGLSLHGGFVPYGGTFLVFSDYSRPAIRLAALMGLPVVHVLSHDSIGLGEDGPTHQPVEHLCALRAIPNLLVIRPADALETIEAWQVALQETRRPIALVLSRQDLTSFDRVAGCDSSLRDGAYATTDEDNPDVILIASGSEVEIVVAAARTLIEVGIRARVVSMPCMELFAEQSDDLRNTLLGHAPRIAVEASIGQSWDRWLRPGDRFIGMNGFGASGRAADLYRHFGITPQAVHDTAVEVLDPNSSKEGVNRYGPHHAAPTARSRR